MVVSTGDIWLSARRNNEAPKAWSFFKLLDLDAGDVFFLFFAAIFPMSSGTGLTSKVLVPKSNDQKISKISLVFLVVFCIGVTGNELLSSTLKMQPSRT